MSLGEIFVNSVEFTVCGQPSREYRPGQEIHWVQTTAVRPDYLLRNHLPRCDVVQTPGNITIGHNGAHLLVFNAVFEVIDQLNGKVMFDVLVNSVTRERIMASTSGVGSYTVHGHSVLTLTAGDVITIRVSDDSNTIRVPCSTCEQPPYPKVLSVILSH